MDRCACWQWMCRRWEHKEVDGGGMLAYHFVAMNHWSRSQEGSSDISRRGRVFRSNWGSRRSRFSSLGQRPWMGSEGAPVDGPLSGKVDRVAKGA